VAEAAREFEVVLTGAGAFPSTIRPRVLWVGVGRGAAELGGLAERLAATLADLGWEPEARPFRPHLTVARTDAVPHRDGQRVAEELRRRGSSWSSAFRSDRLVLFRSHLGGGPARYEPLASAVFRGSVAAPHERPPPSPGGNRC